MVINIKFHGTVMLIGSFLCMPLFASEPDNKEQSDAKKNKPIEAITVEGRRIEMDSGELARGTSELSGEALMKKMGATLGETLANELGVHNASFGSSVGLPIIRGLGGSRVQLLQNSLATWDGSSMSPDHATSLDASGAEAIRVVRGPATLKYGSGANGGVVNVIDKRLPEHRLGGPMEFRWDQRNTIENQRNTTYMQFAYDSDPFIFYLDGFDRSQNNEEIPELAIDAIAAFEQYGVLLDTNTIGFVDNTDADADSINAGMSWVSGNYFAGLAINTINNQYGIPSGSHPEAGHVHADTGNAVGGVRIDLEQRRYDFKAGIRFEDSNINSIILRLADTDYQHDEFEGGATGTLFQNDAQELRLEMTHEWDGGYGELGLHHASSDFSAKGVEAFIPFNKMTRLGGYWIETLKRGPWALELGARLDEQKITAIEPRRLPDTSQTVRTGDTLHRQSSYSLALSRSIAEHTTIGLSFNEGVRAPAVQELLSLGPHLATRSYDIGDSKLQQESLQHHELSVETQWRGHEWQWNWFYTEADNYIYQRNEGFFYDLRRSGFFPQCTELSGCLPVLHYRQKDATLKGYELVWYLPEFTVLGIQHNLHFFTDAVRGQFFDLEDIPRMPPTRFGFSWLGNIDNWSAGLNFVKAGAQNHPGVNESSTPGYHVLNGEVSYLWQTSQQWETLWYLTVKNSTDEEIRNAVSHLRNFAPEPGRTIQLGMRLQFN